MKPEDMAPIIALAERSARREWWRKTEEAMRDDGNSRLPSVRYHRARHFAYQVFGMLSKYVPEACHDDALTDLMINAYGNDIEIAQVPPERDAAEKQRLREAYLAPSQNVHLKTE